MGDNSASDDKAEAREKRLRLKRERFESIMDSSWRQSPADQFSKYMKRNQVLNFLHPALSLLYEMPVKPADLYEFFGEFIDDGAQKLLKISLLQAELSFKQNQVLELNSDPAYVAWKGRLEAYLLEQEHVHETGTWNVRASLFQNDLYLSPALPGLTPKDIGSLPPPGIFPTRSSFTVVQTQVEPPEAGRRSSLEEPYVSHPRPSVLVARESMLPNMGPRPSMPFTAQDIRSIPFAQRFSVFKEGRKSTVMDVGASASETLLLIETTYTRQKERIVLENAIESIEEHKLIDPQGLLFNFNPRNCDREYLASLTALPTKLAELARARASRPEAVVDPSVGADYQEQEEDSDSDGLILPPGKFQDARYLRDAFQVRAEMRRAERKAFLELIRGERLDSDSSEDSLDNEPSSGEEDNEMLLRQLAEAGARPAPKKLNPFLRVLRAPRVSLEDFDNWGGDKVRRTVHGRIRQLPSMIAELKQDQLNLTLKGGEGLGGRKESKESKAKFKPEPRKIDFSEEKDETPEQKEARLRAGMLAKKSEILFLGKASLMENLVKARERRMAKHVQRRGKCKSFGYSKLPVDEETQRKEKLQKTYSLYSDVMGGEESAEPKKETKPASRARGHDHRYCDHDHGPRSRRGSRHRSRSQKRGRSRRSRSRRAARSKPPQKAPRTKTTTDFLFEIPLNQIKETQQWIDSTFPESVWRLNEPLPDSRVDDDFDGDDDEDLVWIEDYNERLSRKVTKDRFEDDLPIRREDLEKIHTLWEPSKIAADARLTFESKPDTKFSLIPEEKIPKPMPGITGSMEALMTNTRNPQAEAMLPSERARNYVLEVFGQPHQDNIIRSFNFVLLDDDY